MDPIVTVDPILMVDPLPMVDLIPMVDTIPMVNTTPMVNTIPMGNSLNCRLVLLHYYLLPLQITFAVPFPLVESLWVCTYNWIFIQVGRLRLLSRRLWRPPDALRRRLGPAALRAGRRRPRSGEEVRRQEVPGNLRQVGGSGRDGVH